MYVREYLESRDESEGGVYVWMFMHGGGKMKRKEMGKVEEQWSVKKGAKNIIQSGNQPLSSTHVPIDPPVSFDPLVDSASNAVGIHLLRIRTTATGGSITQRALGVPRDKI